MRNCLAIAGCALLLMLHAAPAAVAGAVPIDEDRKQEAREEQTRSIIADLDFFVDRFAAFAQGAVEPLLYGRSLPLPAETCAAAQEPRRFGLLIGAADPGPDQLRMNAPDNDVELLANVLASVGTQRDDIHALTGASASRDDIVQAAWRILGELQCGDKVFVYFGGYALLMDDIVGVVAASAHTAPSGATMREALDNARAFLAWPEHYEAIPELGRTMRRTAGLLNAYLDSGLTMLLSGEGVYDRGAPALTSFEIMTSADLSELVTLLRNHRADVTLVLDTNHASDAATLQRQHAAVPDFWSADIRREAAQGGDEEERLRPTRLVASPGDLGVFYSSVDKGLSVETGFQVGEERVRHGLFTFRFAEAMLNGRNATVRDVRDSLDRIVKADDPRRWQQTHRVESTRPDMPVFARGDARQQRTDTIRILEPSGMRGAATFDNQQIDLVGVVDWVSPAKAVLVEGQPATLLGDGRFSATVTLRSGVNTISVMGLTRDDEIHLMPPLEIVFDGDLKKLKGQGRRYAVIIANQNYLPETRFSRLQTPIADAEALRDILTARYGFSTELALGGDRTLPLFLVDAAKEQIDETLYTLSEVTTDQDTVLIYYAGHGVYDERTTNAYWVPVDATRPYNYLSGDGITEHIQRIAARSVILISDSCYSGALRAGGEAPSPLAEVTEQDRQRALLRMAEGRSRILITSGGTEPVMDLGGGGHSIFARALLTGLEKMEAEAFSAEDLFRDYIRPMVSGRAEQMPQFKPIDKTGHEPAADVVFVRIEGPQPAELQ